VTSRLRLGVGSDRSSSVVSTAEVAALRSVGLVVGPPLVAVRVVGVPHVVDFVTAPRGQFLRRVTVVVRARVALLHDLRAMAAGVAGAAGVVGVACIRFGQRDLHEVDRFSGREMVELTATGVALVTASTGRSARPVDPFRTTLAGGDIAVLVRAGWMPADVLVAGSSQVRRRQDQAADAQVVTSRSNAEIAGATHMATAARSAVRADLARQASTLGADGLLIAPFETAWSATRHAVEVSALADAVVAWSRRPSWGPVPRGYPVLPLAGAARSGRSVV
jgi:uncharacterized protein YbjQ (UPF0145 family)